LRLVFVTHAQFSYIAQGQFDGLKYVRLVGSVLTG